MKIEVNGTEYPFPEFDSLTYREQRIVKKLTGLRMGEYADAMEAGDGDMMIGLAAIAVHRDNGQTELDWLMDLGVDAIKFVVEEEDLDVGPPAEAPASSLNGGDSDGHTSALVESGIPASSESTA